MNDFLTILIALQSELSHMSEPVMREMSIISSFQSSEAFSSWPFLSSLAEAGL